MHFPKKTRFLVLHALQQQTRKLLKRLATGRLAADIFFLLLLSPHIVFFFCKYYLNEYFIHGNANISIHLHINIYKYRYVSPAHKGCLRL